MTVLLAPTVELARTVTADVTVEAEYGDTVIEGQSYTAAHHGKRAYNPAPCIDTAIPVTSGTILISHFDLDTVGGVLRAQGHDHLFTPETQGFWALSSFVDVSGPHRLAESGATAEDVARLYGYWAWAQANRVLFPRDEISDQTEAIERTRCALVSILADDTELLAAGEKLRETEQKLNQESFLEVYGEIAVRVAPSFVNHLYTAPDGTVCKACVAYNTVRGSINVSLANPVPGFHAGEFVRDLWGPDAGGKDVIAGSPRGTRMGTIEFMAAVTQLNAALILAEDAAEV
jgi:hypothetical protein